MHISEINIYPIKGCHRISLKEAVVEARGLQYDRRWLLVDKNDWFLTQRKYPKMATIGVEIIKSGLRVSESGAGKLTIPFEPTEPVRVDVRIWKNRCRADAYGGDVNEWFSDVLGAKVRLVHMPDTTKRLAHAPYKVHADDVVSFADGYPFLIIGESSLADLNSRLKEAVPMARFRPNFVVAGSEPFAEDTWRKFKIGNVVFWGVKLCGRCVVTTIDQDTGVKGTEPLKTLAGYRTRSVKGTKKTLFGQNLIADKPGGIVCVGDAIRLIESA